MKEQYVVAIVKLGNKKAVAVGRQQDSPRNPIILWDPHDIWASSGRAERNVYTQRTPYTLISTIFEKIFK